MKSIIIASGFFAVSAFSGYATSSSSTPTAAAVEPTSRIQFLNTSDLKGWTFFMKPTASAEGKVWSAHDGVISFASGYTGYLRTEQSYRNFLLHVEWRWPERAGNSGVFVGQSGRDVNWPLSVQVNLKAGAAGELLAQDTLTFTDGSKKISAGHPAEKTVGEWNTLEIFCKGDAVDATVNGVKQSHADHVPSEGQIAFQLENTAVDFRNIYLEPLGSPKK